MKNVQVHRHYHSALSPILVHTTDRVSKKKLSFVKLSIWRSCCHLGRNTYDILGKSKNAHFGKAHFFRHPVLELGKRRGKEQLVSVLKAQKAGRKHSESGKSTQETYCFITFEFRIKRWCYGHSWTMSPGWFNFLAIGPKLAEWLQKQRLCFFVTQPGFGLWPKLEPL